jgi:hypothetical protein
MCIQHPVELENLIFTTRLEKLPPSRHKGKVTLIDTSIAEVMIVRLCCLSALFVIECCESSKEVERCHERRASKDLERSNHDL